MTIKELVMLAEQRCAESEEKFPNYRAEWDKELFSPNRVQDVITFLNSRDENELLEIDLIVEGTDEPICTALMDHEMVEKALEVGITKILGEYVGMAHGIDHITFSDPATIVHFLDGDKVVVKVEDGDDYFPATGVAWAIAKKLFGSTTKFMEFVKDAYGREEYERFEIQKMLAEVIMRLGRETDNRCNCSRCR